MNPWPFITAAYAIALGGTAAIAWLSWRAMRAAEKGSQ